MDVAFLTQGWSPDPGGVETHTLALARGLVGRGHRVRALCLEGRGERAPYTLRAERRAGVDVARMAYRYHDHRALADLVHNPRSERVVLDWLAAAPAEVLHVHHLTGFGPGVLTRLRGAPLGLVVSLHDYWLLCPRGQMFDVDGRAVPAPEPEHCGRCLAATWPHLMPSGASRGMPGEGTGADAAAAAARTASALGALAAADRLVVPSPEAGAVFERAGVAAARLSVIEYGLDAAALARAVARERAARGGRAGAEFVLGFLGSVLPSKGPLELARAVQQAGARGLRLEIHGPQPSWHGDTRYLEALRALAAGDGRIALHGAFAPAELPRVLARLDAVAVPSRWEETYGLVAREARAAGLPVLVSDRGGLPPSARGRADGSAVVGADDPAGWARALRRLVDRRARPSPPDPEPAEGDGQGLGDMLDAFEALYREVAGGKARGRAGPGSAGHWTSAANV